MTQSVHFGDYACPSNNYTEIVVYIVLGCLNLGSNMPLKNQKTSLYPIDSTDNTDKYNQLNVSPSMHNYELPT